jgi:hypothetical protein
MNSAFTTRRTYRGTRVRHYAHAAGSGRSTAHVSNKFFTSSRYRFFVLLHSPEVDLALRILEYGIVAYCLDAACGVLEAIGNWLLARFWLRRRGELLLTSFAHWLTCATTSPSTRLALPCSRLSRRAHPVYSKPILTTTTCY